MTCVILVELDEDAPFSVEEEDNPTDGVPVFPNAQVQPQQALPTCELWHFLWRVGTMTIIIA